jgi:hypothetical protein
MAEASARSFANPLTDDAEDDSTFDVEAAGGAAQQPAGGPKKLSEFTSQDVGLRTVDSDGGERSVKGAIKTFKRHDEDNGGTLDREEFASVLRSLGRADDSEAVDKVMKQMGDIDGSFEAEVTEVTLQMFVTWFTEHLDEPEPETPKSGGAKKVGKLGQKLAAPGKKLGKKLMGAAKTIAGGEAIAPESLFVIDSRGNDEARRKAEVVMLIHEKHDTGLHHLEDMILSRDLDSHWGEVWEQKAAANFDEDAVAKRLQWPSAMVTAVKDTMMGLDMPETVSKACYRVFLQREAPLILDRIERSSAKLTGSSNKELTVGKLKKLALKWVERAELQEDLGEDLVPLEHAIVAVKEALKVEVKLRRSKMEDLTSKLEAIPGDMPVHVRVEGLRGASVSANGVYVASGLRQFWGRPLYTQHLNDSGFASTTHNVLFYDMRHDTEETAVQEWDELWARLTALGWVQEDGYYVPPVKPKVVVVSFDGEQEDRKQFETQEQVRAHVRDPWTDGVWVLGPTLNSDRCTAWIPEVDPKKAPLLFPPSTVNAPDGGGWLVYDTVNSKWKNAPGTHCPSFSLSSADKDGENMKDYFQKAVDDQESVRTRVEAMLSGETDDKSLVNFDELLRATMTARAGMHPTLGPTITASDYMSWRATFYHDELKELQTTIEEEIKHDPDCSFFDDPEDNLEEVRAMLDDYVLQVEQRQEERRAAKRRFMARVSRPALSRAFFQWKLAARSNMSASMADSGMFHEPTLPWNVRHPHSSFTATWESVQAFLLIYIAFTVLWRLCFNQETQPGEFYYYFEYFIDCYFSIDVVFNFHTAYYDEAGDLRGTKVGGSGQGSADLKALYINYCKNWMVIDVASVLPIHWIVTQFQDDTSEESGKQLKLMKVVRLIRLTKLLRLARGMRMFKKYEDKLGPLLNATMLVGTVILLLHSITCIWFAVGSARDDLTGAATGAMSSKGWIEHLFKGSETHCSCYNDTFYDPVDRICVSRVDGDGAEIRDMCEGTADQMPSLVSYYLQSAFSVFQDPGIADQYSNSVAELVSAAAVTGVMGFLWGAVAGAWGTIFAANQMASQAYRMKISQVKEFCRVKQLEHGAKAKLTAHYEHLYPEQVIVDEKAILLDLPPRMREELVRSLYGTIITSVPIFFRQDTMVLTELCMALTALPALKGELIVREGQKGYEMHCLASGSCRVTQHLRGSDDVARTKTWIEETFQAKGTPVNLFDANLRVHLEQLLRKMKVMARKKLKNWRNLSEQLESAEQQLTSLQSMSGVSVDHERVANADTVEEVSLMLTKLVSRELTWADLQDDDELKEMVARAGARLPELLKAARKQERLEYDGEVPPPPGKVVQFRLKPGKQIEGDTPIQMLCASLRDGVFLLDLLNTFLPPKQRMDVWRPSGLSDVVSDVASIVTDTVAIADDAASGAMKMAGDVTDQATKATLDAAKQGASFVPGEAGAYAAEAARRAEEGIEQAVSAGRALNAGHQQIPAAILAQDAMDSRTCKPNLKQFVGALSNPELPFKLDPGNIARADDFLQADRGTVHDQQHRQKRILKCLLHLAAEVGQMPSYYGPKLDEVRFVRVTH